MGGLLQPVTGPQCLTLMTVSFIFGIVVTLIVIFWREER